MKKNNFYLGIVIGAVLPAVAWVLFNYCYKNLVLMHKPAIPYLVAVAINLLLIRFFHHAQADKTSRGIMLITFIFLIFIFLIKLKV